MKKRLFLISCLLLFPLLSAAVPLELLETLDSANQAYLSRDYSRSKLLFDEFLTGLTPDDLREDSVKSIVADIKENLSELHMLVLWQEPLEFLKNAADLENKKKLPEALSFYQKALTWYKANNVTQAHPFGPLSRGELENFLLERKKANLERFSYSFLEKIRQDKKRKKTLVIFSLTPLGASDNNISTLVENSLIGTLQRRNFFTLIRKPVGLKAEEQASWIQERSVDLYVEGTYEKLPRGVVRASFSVYDGFSAKKLIDVTMSSPLDLDFFQTVERIANDFANNLSQYSRFEDFSLIRYVKEGTRQLKKEQNTEDSGDIQVFLSEKIHALTLNHLKFLMSLGHGGKIQNYQQAAKELLKYEETKPLKPLFLPELIQSEKGMIFQTLDDKTDMQDFLSDMKEAVEEKDLADYQDAHEEALTFIKEELRPLLPSYAALLTEYQERLEEKLKTVSAQAKTWPAKTVETHSLSFYTGSGALFSLSYTYRFPWYLDAGVSLGYAYEKQDYTELERHALPLGLRLSAYYTFGQNFEPYVFAQGFYYLGLQNYFERFMALGGAGVRLYGSFFVEGGLMLNQEVTAPAIGLGVRLSPEEPLKLLQKARTSAGLIIGSGALATLFYALRFGDFEVAPTLGLLYAEDWIVKRVALPIGLRASYYPLVISVAEPYVFAAGFHYFGLSEYKPRFAALAGIGTKIYTHFFMEAGYMISKSNEELIAEETGQGLVLGAGARLDF